MSMPRDCPPRTAFFARALLSRWLVVTAALAGLLLPVGAAQAASYQDTFFNVFDPIQIRGEFGGGDHPYAGPNLEPFVFAFAEDLSQASLFGADLDGSDLSECNFTDADLSDARLTNAVLSNANLTRAQLFNADLTNASLFPVNLTDADLTSANLSGVDLSDATLSGVRGQLLVAPMSVPFGYEVVNSYILGPDVHLSFADLSGQSLSGIDLSGADLSYASLSGATLDSVSLRDDLNGRIANVVGVDLSNATLTGVSLAGQAST
jgi:uncharacterized protein YjbI with pentapeptide repeats